MRFLRGGLFTKSPPLKLPPKKPKKFLAVTKLVSGNCFFFWSANANLSITVFCSDIGDRTLPLQYYKDSNFIKTVYKIMFL